MPAHLLQEEVSSPALAPGLPDRGARKLAGLLGDSWMGELRSPRRTEPSFASCAAFIGWESAL